MNPLRSSLDHSASTPTRKNRSFKPVIETLEDIQLMAGFPLHDDAQTIIPFVTPETRHIDANNDHVYQSQLGHDAVLHVAQGVSSFVASTLSGHANIATITSLLTELRTDATEMRRADTNADELMPLIAQLEAIKAGWEEKGAVIPTLTDPPRVFTSEELQTLAHTVLQEQADLQNFQPTADVLFLRLMEAVAVLNSALDAEVEKTRIADEALQAFGESMTAHVRLTDELNAKNAVIYESEQQIHNWDNEIRSMQAQIPNLHVAYQEATAAYHVAYAAWQANQTSANDQKKKDAYAAMLSACNTKLNAPTAIQQNIDAQAAEIALIPALRAQRKTLYIEQSAARTRLLAVSQRAMDTRVAAVRATNERQAAEAARLDADDALFDGNREDNRIRSRNARQVEELAQRAAVTIPSLQARYRRELQEVVEGEESITERLHDGERSSLVAIDTELDAFETQVHTADALTYYPKKEAYEAYMTQVETILARISTTEDSILFTDTKATVLQLQSDANASLLAATQVLDQLERERPVEISAQESVTFVEGIGSSVLTLEQWSDKLAHRDGFLERINNQLSDAEHAALKEEIVLQRDVIGFTESDASSLLTDGYALLQAAGGIREENGAIQPPDEVTAITLDYAMQQALMRLYALPELAERVSALLDRSHVETAMEIGTPAFEFGTTQLSLRLPLLGGSGFIRPAAGNLLPQASIEPPSATLRAVMNHLASGGSISTAPFMQGNTWERTPQAYDIPWLNHGVAGRIVIEAFQRPVPDYGERMQRVMVTPEGYIRSANGTGKLGMQLARPTYIHGVKVSVVGDGQPSILSMHTPDGRVIRRPIGRGGVIHIGEVITLFQVEAGQDEEVTLESMDMRLEIPTGSEVPLPEDAMQVSGNMAAIDLAESESMVTGVHGRVHKITPHEQYRVTVYSGEHQLGSMLVTEDGSFDLSYEGITGVIIEGGTGNIIVSGLHADGVQGVPQLRALPITAATNAHYARISSPNPAYFNWNTAYWQSRINFQRPSSGPMQGAMWSHAGWMVQPQTDEYVLYNIQGGAGQFLSLSYYDENLRIRPYPTSGYEVFGGRVLIYPTGRSQSTIPNNLWMHMNADYMHMTDIGPTREEVMPPQEARPDLGMAGRSRLGESGYWGAPIFEWPGSVNQSESFQANINVTNEGIEGITFTSISVHVGPTGTPDDPIDFTLNTPRSISGGQVVGLYLPIRMNSEGYNNLWSISGRTNDGRTLTLYGGNFRRPRPGRDISEREIVRRIGQEREAVAAGHLTLSQNTLNLYNRIIARYQQNGTIAPEDFAAVTANPEAPEMVRLTELQKNEFGWIYDSLVNLHMAQGDDRSLATQRADNAMKIHMANPRLFAQRFGVNGFNGSAEGMRRYLQAFGDYVNGKITQIAGGSNFGSSGGPARTGHWTQEALARVLPDKPEIQAHIQRILQSLRLPVNPADGAWYIQEGSHDHEGLSKFAVDFNLPGSVDVEEGKAVKAMADGVVVEIDESIGRIVLRHEVEDPDTGALLVFFTEYVHLKEINFEILNGIVEAGRDMGLIGKTASQTANLHVNLIFASEDYNGGTQYISVDMRQKLLAQGVRILPQTAESERNVGGAPVQLGPLTQSQSIQAILDNLNTRTLRINQTNRVYVNRQTWPGSLLPIFNSNLTISYEEFLGQQTASALGELKSMLTYEFDIFGIDAGIDAFRANADAIIKDLQSEWETASAARRIAIVDAVGVLESLRGVAWVLKEMTPSNAIEVGLWLCGGKITQVAGAAGAYSIKTVNHVIPIEAALKFMLALAAKVKAGAMADIGTAIRELSERLVARHASEPVSTTIANTANRMAGTEAVNVQRSMNGLHREMNDVISSRKVFSLESWSAGKGHPEKHVWFGAPGDIMDNTILRNFQLRQFSDPNITGSSKFYNKANAEYVINQAVNTNENRLIITAFLTNPTKTTETIYFSGNSIIGRGISNLETIVSDRKNAIIRLVKDSTLSRGYYVITAYPSL